MAPDRRNGEPANTYKPWYRLWMLALLTPTHAAFNAIADQPGTSVGKASLWIFLAAVAGGTIGLTSVSTLQGRFSAGDLLQPIVVAAVVTVAVLFQIVGVEASVRWISKKGSYRRAVIALSAAAAPLALIGTVSLSSGLVTFVGLWPIWLLLGTKHVNSITWWQAIRASYSVFMPLVVVAVLAALFSGLFLSQGVR